jgi:hypothetical protein
MGSNYPLEQVKRDVDCCIDIWSEILAKDLRDRVEYAYAKGSCIKQWSSAIDYVPVFSDVDIHIKLRDGKDFYPNSYKGFVESLSTTETYEDMFGERNPGSVHLPRVQVVLLNPNLSDPDFMLPWDLGMIRPMVGEPKLREPPEHTRLRSLDLMNLLNQAEVLETLPLSACERTGLEYWILVRRLGWRVSSTPVRLLSQVANNPLRVWGLNRTEVCEELDTHRFEDIRNSYKDYYMLGWDAFQSDFRNSHTMREVLKAAYRVLETTIKHAKTLSKQDA